MTWMTRGEKPYFRKLLYGFQLSNCFPTSSMLIFKNGGGSISIHFSFPTFSYIFLNWSICSMHFEGVLYYSISFLTWLHPGLKSQVWQAKENSMARSFQKPTSVWWMFVEHHFLGWFMIVLCQYSKASSWSEPGLRHWNEGFSMEKSGGNYPNIIQSDYWL